jgi:hypothetical protein
MTSSRMMTMPSRRHTCHLAVTMLKAHPLHYRDREGSAQDCAHY